MNSQWKAFLESHGAIIDQDGQVHFPATQSVPACALSDLSHLGLLRIKGEDAVEFLQGLSVNDIRELSETHSQLNSSCTPKGRMLASYRAFRRGEDIYLQMPHETLEPLLKRLSMYVLRSKVTLANASDELISLGIAGNSAADLLKDSFSSLPGEPESAIQEHGLTLIRLLGDPQRYLVVGEEAAMEGLWKQLAKGATAVDEDYWALTDIRAGIPTVYAPTIEAFIPQMVNLQLINGVSFNKGCYCGQEIVTRVEHRGTLKRRMYLAHVDTDQRPGPGDTLFSPSAEQDKEAGIIVDARPAPGGGYDLLAMLQIGSFEAGDVRLGDNQGPELSFRELPYAFI